MISGKMTKHRFWNHIWWGIWITLTIKILSLFIFFRKDSPLQICLFYELWIIPVLENVTRKLSSTDFRKWSWMLNSKTKADRTPFCRSSKKLKMEKICCQNRIVILFLRFFFFMSAKLSPQNFTIFWPFFLVICGNASTVLDIQWYLKINPKTKIFYPWKCLIVISKATEKKKNIANMRTQRIFLM